MQLLFFLGLLFSAGTDTTAATIDISLALLCKYPNKQDELRNIVTQLWEKNGKPMINNGEFKQFDTQWLIGRHHGDKQREKLINLFEAFIQELMRIASVATHGIPHYNTNESFEIFVKKEYGTLDGKDHTYIIPKGTIIMLSVFIFVFFSVMVCHALYLLVLAMDVNLR